jgi:hypothetical protein
MRKIIAAVVAVAGLLMASGGPAAAATAEGALRVNDGDGLPFPYCLAVTWGGGSNNGDSVRVTTCDSRSVVQRFTIDGNAVAPVKVRGQCLDVSGGARHSGARVQVWECNGTGAQQWAFDWVPGTDFWLMRNPQSNLCLHSNFGGSVIAQCDPLPDFEHSDAVNMFRLEGQIF